MKIEMRKILVVVVFSICFVSVAWADLAQKINSIVSQSSQRKVKFSICIVKADTGQAVYSHNAYKALVPASNMKIIVTAAALKYLGADYEYKTEVGLCGNTIVVKGSGDPLLGDVVTDRKYSREDGWVFKDIAVLLKRNNVIAAKDIVVDSSIFDDQRVHPNWPVKDLNRWYACEVSGLNFNGNCIDVAAKNNGGKTTIVITPETSFVQIVNKVIPISKGNSVAGSYRDGELNKIVVYGKCRDKTGPFPVAIERPAVFFGYLLAEELVSAGIKLDGQLIEKVADPDCDFNKLVEYRSSISDCLARCNKNSFGLAAEALLKTIAVHSKHGGEGENGSWTEGQRVISEYLAGLGIGKKEFHIDDGSGLSRQNKLSANVITKVLYDVYKNGDWELYRKSLAVGGIDGTISKYFKEGKYKGKVFGKTGYINGVKSFSGFCSTQKGDYIFSILANNAKGQTRSVINNIVKAIIDFDT